MTAPTIHPGDLEPSLVSAQTYVTRRRILRLDVTTLVGIMLILLTLIPTRYIIPGTTDVGRPAIVVCVGLWCWWFIARLSPSLVLVGPQPIRWAVFIYWLSITASYAAGLFRGLTTMEANSADRWLIGTAAFTGLILTVADGTANWGRLKTLLKVFVVCAVGMALIGLLEAVLSAELTQYMSIPGLAEKGAPPELQSRGGGLRVASTATHYIELSAVLATALPFAVHFGRFADSQKQRRRFVLAATIIGAGIVATISRTGIVAGAICFMALVPLWTWRMRYNALFTAFGVFGALAVAKPSYAATIIDMFVNVSNDPSITSRTEDYDMVGYYFSQTPWLGRGTGTWVVPQYKYLDNQWLVTALCNGIIGVVALAAVFIIALVLAAVAFKRVENAEDRHLCAGLISTQIIAIFASATFDALWFDTYAITVAFTIGLCGAVWRFSHPARQVRTAVPRWLAN